MNAAKPAPGRGRPTRANRATPANAAAAGSGTETGVTRGARRRRETRARLLNAALRLMGERGMDAVAVNEITEAADVGFGSFYNHFESKEAIHRALIDLVFEEFADALDRALADVSDPAEVIAASIRHTLYRARRDGVWARFLLREGLSSRMLTRGLGVRLLRDIQNGIASGRFPLDDALTAFIGLAGSTLAALAVEIEYGQGSAGTISPDVSRALALPDPDLPERAAAALLRFLGLPDGEAREIARRPLAVLDASREPRT